MNAEGKRTGVIGFLTGSIGLLATARELLEPLHPGRFKFVMGLAHAQGGNAGEAELHAVLDDLHGKGVRRIVLVDEVKSGSQMTAGMKAAIRWVRSTGAKDTEITAVGVSGRPPKDKERPPTVAELVTKAGLTQQIINPRTVTAMSLLEMDTDGLKFRGVEKRKEYIGEYDYYREQPNEGLFIACPAGGESGGGGIRSLDTAFAGTVNRILGLSHRAADVVPINVTDDPDGGEIPPAITWPDTIENGSCQICRDLFRTAREVATLRHYWTSVAGTICRTTTSTRQIAICITGSLLRNR